MRIRRVNFQNPQLLHLKTDKFLGKKVISKPAVHKKQTKQIDEINLNKYDNRQEKEHVKALVEQIERLEDKSKEIIIIFIEHSINRKLTPGEKIKLKKLIV